MQNSGERCRENAKLYPRHCERSEAIHASTRGKMDCFRLRSPSYGGQVAARGRVFINPECAGLAVYAPPRKQTSGLAFSTSALWPGADKTNGREINETSDAGWR